MMIMTSKLLLSATAVVAGITAVSMPAFASDRFDRTDVRQAKQAHRIEQGIRSGELTRGEAAKLQHQQSHIRAMERSAERDGHISRYERSRIEAAQNAASRSIYAEKHDRQDRDHGHGKRRWFGKWGHHDHDNGHRRWNRWF